MRLIQLILCFTALFCAKAAATVNDISGSGQLSGAWFIENDEMDRVDAYLIVRTGEFEAEGTEGLSHYLEHLVWQHAIGLESEGKLARDTNAFTSGHSVTYFLAGDAAELNNNLRILSRVFESPRLPEKFMLEERKIVHQEYQLRFTEWPWLDASNKFENALYGPGFRARSIIGSPDEILRFDPREAIALHAKTHVPANAALLVIGKATPANVRDLYARNFKSFASVGERPAPPRYGFQENHQLLVAAIEKIPIQRFIYAKRLRLPYPVPLARLTLLTNTLSDILMSTRKGSLAKPMQYDSFTASWVDAAFDVVSENEITLRFSAEPDIGVSLNHLQAKFESEMAALAEEGIPLPTFSKIVGQSRKQLQTLELKRARQLSLALSRINLEMSPVDLEQFDQELASITRKELEDILRVASGPGKVIVMYANRKETQ